MGWTVKARLQAESPDQVRADVAQDTVCLSIAGEQFPASVALLQTDVGVATHSEEAHQAGCARDPGTREAPEAEELTQPSC